MQEAGLVEQGEVETVGEAYVLDVRTGLRHRVVAAVDLRQEDESHAALAGEGLQGAHLLHQLRLVAALVDRPLTAREAQVGQVSCRISPVEGGVALTARIAMPSAGGQEFVVVETANPSIWVAEAETRRAGNILTASTEMQHVEGAPFALDRSGLRFTVLGKRHAVDIRGCASG